MSGFTIDGRKVILTEEHLHNRGFCYPFAKAPITLTSSGTAWAKNAATVTIIGNSSTLDNAAVVDATGGVVTIPATGHHLKPDYYVKISGTVNYDGTYLVLAAAANTFNITATYVAETLAGTETAVDVIPDEFDIHFVHASSISATGHYEIILYSGAAGAEIEITRVPVTRSAVFSQEGDIPSLTIIQDAETRISADLLSSNAAANTVAVKIISHMY